MLTVSRKLPMLRDYLKKYIYIYRIYHTVQESHSLVFTQTTEELRPHRSQHTDDYSSFIHNCQSVEAPKMPCDK